MEVGPGTAFPYSFDIPVATDDLIEGPELMEVGLVSPEVPDSAQVSVGGTASCTITSADSASLGIIYSGGDVAEGDSASFQITEANGVTLDQTYTITLSYGGDVDPDADLPARPLTVEVGPGTAFPYSFDIPVATDDLIEGPRA